MDPIKITEELIRDLAYHAELAPSCNNNQPWRFVFVYDDKQLTKIHATLSKNNKWMESASMIIAVFSRQGEDCVVKDRVYNQFDTGMATALLILRATELGLVAHPVAGYDEAEVKLALDIPDNYQIIALVNIGIHSDKINQHLSEKQVATELERPPRYPFEKFAYLNKYTADAPTTTA